MILGITQARVGSSRLPRKVLMTTKDKSLLAYHLERALKSQLVSEWIVATTLEDESDNIISIAESVGVPSFQGDTNDVLKRFFDASKEINPEYIVRVTSDCPLLDPQLVDDIISYTLHNNLAYCVTSENYPDGVDVEVFKFAELRDANANAKLASDREHVTPYIKRKPGNNALINIFPCTGNYNNIRFTVDEKDDFRAIETLIENLGDERQWKEYADFIIDNNDLFPNQKIIRNEGYIKSIQKNGA